LPLSRPPYDPEHDANYQNSGMFTVDVEGKTVIDLQRFSAKIGHTEYDARINYVLPKLIEAFDSHAQLPQLEVKHAMPIASLAVPPTIEHDWLWNVSTT